MTTAFPGALDAYGDPSGGATQGSTTPTHSGHHQNHNDAIEALEAKLGIGASVAASNQVLRGTGAGATAFGQVQAADIAVGAAPQLIETTGVLGGAIASWTTATLPTGYKHLLIRGQVKSSTTGATSDSVALRFNGDGGTNYYVEGLQGLVSSASAFEVIAGSSGLVALVGTALAHATAAGSFTLEVPNYNGTALVKQWLAQSIAYCGAATGQQVVRVTAGTWIGTGIFSLTLFTSTGSIAAGSIISVYGVN
jgi:hypothetical protein